MKKYSVKNLYVIETKYGNELKYYICSKNFLNDSYKEIFTDRKIDYEIIESAEAFEKYCNGSEFITEDDLLRKFVVINIEASLKNGEVKQKNSYIEFQNILDEATLRFFPKEGNWLSSCFDKKRNKELDMEFLPCNLRDDVWLSHMLKSNQNLYFISNEKVYDYVKTSKLFDQKRCEYEQKIVKWQIKWMKNGGENWLTDSAYGGDCVFLTSKCDLGFRKGIVDTLTAIGMNLEAIEEGIESNAFLWRDSFMKMAFHNLYASPFIDAFSEPEDKLEQPSEEFLENWIRLRKYEYYQEHQKSVENYGFVEPCMKMSAEELYTLKEYLKKEHENRMKYINDYKEKTSYKVLTLTKE